MQLWKKLIGVLGVIGLAAATLSGAPARATANTELSEAAYGEYTERSVQPFPRAFYDINLTNPQTMRDFLGVINDTFDLLVSKGAQPRHIEFVVSLRGLSVAFAAADFGLGDPQNEQLGLQIRQLLTTLANKGVRLEACLISCQWVGVDPDSLVPQVLVIDNAFASSIWYQNRGYALIPIHQLP